MVSTGMKALTAGLKKAYPKATIYGEEIGKDMKYPAFIVRLIVDTLKKELGKRRRNDIEFQVVYITDTHKNADYQEEIPKIYMALEVVEYGGIKYRTKYLTAKIENRTLYITGELSTKLYRVPEVQEEIIQEARQNIKYKKG